jgi:hypothetical protein
MLKNKFFIGQEVFFPDKSEFKVQRCLVLKIEAPEAREKQLRYTVCDAECYQLQRAVHEAELYETDDDARTTLKEYQISKIKL